MKVTVDDKVHGGFIALSVQSLLLVSVLVLEKVGSNIFYGIVRSIE